MAFDKAKVLKAAEKFLSQGNITAAIKEYRLIVDHDEADLTALNMLGDLCARAGLNEEAINCFLHIAEHYRQQEFNLKAIAMFKKIDRLNPRNPGIAEKLATLYASQGLVVDARAQYLVVADALSRAGEAKQALDVLHKIADLDPHNTDVRLKLAEGYLKEGLRSDAATTYAEAGSRLFDYGKFEKSLEAYTRALEITPHHQASLRGLVSAHVALGTAYEAAEILERVAEQRPDDIELMSILLYAYLEAQDAEGAERATATLMTRDVSSYVRFFDVARLYLDGGDVDSAVRVLAGITERVLAGREESLLLELVNEVLARDPEHVTALRLLVRIHWWQRDMEKLRAALERLAEAAEAAGLVEDERYALTQLVRLAPVESYVERLRALGGAQEDLADESFPDSLGAEVPTFESFSIVKDEVEEGAQTDATPPADEFEFNSVATETVSDPNSSFADLNESLESSSGAPGYDHSLGDTGPVAAGDGPSGASASGGGERVEQMMSQELESVDFYIAQGYFDIAADTLELLQRQFGSHAEIDARRSKLKNGGVRSGAAEPETGFVDFELDDGSGEAGSVEADVDLAFGDVEMAGQPTPSNVEAPAGSARAGRPALHPALTEVFEEFRIAAEEDIAPANDDYETHYNMGTAYKEMDLLDEAIQEFQSAAALVKPNDGTPRYMQCCNMLGHCFGQKNLPRAAVKWFKQGLETPGHGEEEYQALRYDLGSAYEQSGDLDRAIEVFTDVYSIDVSYRGVADRLRELQTQKAAKS